MDQQLLLTWWVPIFAILGGLSAIIFALWRLHARVQDLEDEVRQLSREPNYYEDR